MSKPEPVLYTFEDLLTLGQHSYFGMVRTQYNNPPVTALLLLSAEETNMSVAIDKGIMLTSNIKPLPDMDLVWIDLNDERVTSLIQLLADRGYLTATDHYFSQGYFTYAVAKLNI